VVTEVVGVWVGLSVGLSVGPPEVVTEKVGVWVGLSVGLSVGPPEVVTEKVGVWVGLSVGLSVGPPVGARVGSGVGLGVGFSVGDLESPGSEGDSVGSSDSSVGSSDGKSEVMLGTAEGATEMEGAEEMEGAPVGASTTGTSSVAPEAMPARALNPGTRRERCFPTDSSRFWIPRIPASANDAVPTTVATTIARNFIVLGLNFIYLTLE